MPLLVRTCISVDNILCDLRILSKTLTTVSIILSLLVWYLEHLNHLLNVLLTCFKRMIPTVVGTSQNDSSTMSSFAFFHPAPVVPTQHHSRSLLSGPSQCFGNRLTNLSHALLFFLLYMSFFATKIRSNVCC